MANPNSVRIVARVVPDGVRLGPDDKPAAYRISLALLPDLRKENNGVEIDIAQWPAQIAKKIQAVCGDRPGRCAARVRTGDAWCRSEQHR